MRGDFSAWNKDRSHNFRGTLHQQGRVLLDRDWNAQIEIIGEWQDTAARDAFGAGIAAVPADAPLGFKVVKAEITGGEVKVSLKKGRVWADGLLAELYADQTPPAGADAVRTATYLEPPLQDPAGKVSDLPNNRRDAVILETWLEELSPFQNTGLLLEPALGGVDTTERVQAAYRFRLFRLGKDANGNDETCETILGKLKDDPAKKGKLSVNLKPNTMTGGDCPVVESGGYTGFEHHLYRIEIADTDRAGNFFKWSQFNGGLVGTGDFDAANRKVDIYGNRNAIVYSGLKDFYLEALNFNQALGCWQVVYGAKVKLGTDNMIELPSVAGSIFKGSIPGAPAAGKQFFRLWNGIEPVANYTAEKELPDNVGIHVKLEAEGVAPNKKYYRPGDFWTFEVHAGNIGNPLKLVDNLPPQGIYYHRVPLAELHWASASIVDNDAGNDNIEDCRHIFQPLTRLKACCTYRVGDGVHTFGDFTKIQDAVNALHKDKGGEICILPGIYKESVAIYNRSNVTLSGCGKRSIVSGNIDISQGNNITVRSLVVNAGAVAVTADQSENVALDALTLWSQEAGLAISSSRKVKFTSSVIESAGRGVNLKAVSEIVFKSLAIKAGETGINGEYLQNFSFEESVIDAKSAGIFLTGERKKAQDEKQDAYLMNVSLSRLRVTAFMKSGVAAENAQFLSLKDSVIHIRDSEQPGELFLNWAVNINGYDLNVEGNELRALPDKVRRPEDVFSNDPARFVSPSAALGGLRIGADSRRVQIDDNLIVNGMTHGISLGGIDVMRNGKSAPGNEMEIMKALLERGFVEGRAGSAQFEGGLPLEDISIRRNRILNMDGNGISVLGFIGDPAESRANAAPAGLDGNLRMIFIRRLEIDDNRIESCVNRPIPIPDHMLSRMGFGGVVLADVDGLIVRDNSISCNAPDLRAAVCGIYVIHVDGVEISRNHIDQVNWLGTRGRDDTGTARPGPRGGIWINYADNLAYRLGGMQRRPDLRGIIPPIVASFKGATAKIEGNIVNMMLGRCLTLGVEGVVSVANNTFITFNAPPENSIEILQKFVGAGGNLDDKTAFQALDCLAGNVLIFERSSLIPAWTYLFGEIAGIDKFSAGTRTMAYRAAYRRSDMRYAGGRQAAEASNIPPDIKVGAAGALPRREPIDPSFDDSNFIFANNQCHQHVIDEREGYSLTSITIATDRDASFTANQASCRLIEVPVVQNFNLPFPLVNSFVFARSCRVSDNRFTETDDGSLSGISMESLPQFPLSARTVANWNITSDNIGTHCIKVEDQKVPYGNKLPLYLNRYNLIEVEGIFGDITRFDGTPPCLRERETHHVIPPRDPKYTAGMLDNYYTYHVAEYVNLQASKQVNYRNDYQRARELYGDEAAAAMPAAKLMEISADELRSARAEYVAAVTPLSDAGEGWAVDGFARTVAGEIAPGITIAAYDEKGAWYREFGHTCSDENGYFLLEVKKLPAKIPALFLGASRESKKIDTAKTKLEPAVGGSDRVELRITDESVKGNCAPPQVDNTPDDVPPDSSPEAGIAPDKLRLEKEEAERKKREAELKAKKAAEEKEKQAAEVKAAEVKAAEVKAEVKAREAAPPVVKPDAEPKAGPKAMAKTPAKKPAAKKRTK